MDAYCREDRLAGPLCMEISWGDTLLVKKLCEMRLLMFRSKTLKPFRVETVREACPCFAIPNDIVYPPLDDEPDFYPNVLSHTYVEQPKLEEMIFAGKCFCVTGDRRTDVLREITPLVVACYFGHEEIVRYLLEVDSGAINRNGYMTPLMMTTICRNKSSRLAIAKLLLRSGADVNVTDKWSGMHPLQFAVWKNDIKMTKLLLEKGVDVNSLQMSPLTIVNSTECRKLLLNAGANVANPIAHRCPLHCAIRDHQVDDVKDFLNSSTFQKEHTYSDSDLSIVQFAAESVLYPPSKGDFEIVDLLLEKGLSVDSYQSENLTTDDISKFRDSMETRFGRAVGPATFMAADNGDPEIQCHLLNQGANENFRNVFGMTALMVLACRKFRPDLGYGTEEKLDMQCLSVLQQCDIDLNARDICGRSAIFYALRDREEELFMFKWLLVTNVELYTVNQSTDRLRFRDEKSLFYHTCLKSCYCAMDLLLYVGYNIRKETWLMERKRIPSMLLENTKALQLLVSIFRIPEELKRICRNEIRRLLGVDIQASVKQSMLPTMLQDYLMFK